MARFQIDKRASSLPGPGPDRRFMPRKNCPDPIKSGKGKPKRKAKTNGQPKLPVATKGEEAGII
ncbi:hypothetical protein [Azovibrio restrictus]|jgi:hypothetical protein|uniref:hypothetical protein n=1 Tax=Azovibrio restrictus TaxID=146938 RepID=UPI0026EBD773|nr:hypothetical protein [Azovibrio restrictus]